MKPNFINSSSENIDHYKNLRKPLQNYKRVYISKKSVLIFRYFVKENYILFKYFDYRDYIYLKKQ